MLMSNDLLRISIRQVLRQKRRYMGVVLSIALGVAGFIIILSMGREVKSKLNEDLNLLGGATVIKVSFQDALTDQDHIERPNEFLERTVDAMRRIPGVQAVTVSSTFIWGQSSKGKSFLRYPLYGVDEFYWDVNGIQPMLGKFFGAEEVRARQKVCVLGEELAKQIFGQVDVVGKYLEIDKTLYLVQAILETGSLRDRANWAYIPYTTQEDYLGAPKMQRLYVRCRTWDDVGPVSEEIPRVVKAEQADRGLLVEVAWGVLRQVTRMVFWVELFSYFSVCATMVLGGFGIWSGMMTAVKARTREIGLKKAMGAEDRDILLQFLAESVSLSLGAAVLGVVGGRLGVALVSQLLHSESQMYLFMIYSMLSILFSLLLGIGAGFYPALRASRMEVVSAIRYE